MAYQTRQRDPLLDSQTHAVLVRRGEELMGLLLLALGAMLFAMLASYAPDDPNYFDATDALPQNLFGRLGATFSEISVMMIGYSAYLLPVAALVWGGRFLLHLGTERSWRAILVPIAVAVMAIYCASLTPPETWSQGFGLGGLFGDTFLGVLLNILPFAPHLGLRVMAAISFFGGLAVLLFACGMNQPERRAVVRFLLTSAVAAMTSTARSVKRTIAGTSQAATGMADRARSRREARVAAADIVRADAPLQAMQDPVHMPVPTATAEETAPRRAPGLLGRVPMLRSRGSEPEPDLEPELVTPEPELPIDPNLPDGDRLRAKIASAVKTRIRRSEPVPDATTARRSATPPLTRNADAPPVSAPIAAAVARVTSGERRAEPVLSAAGMAARLIAKRKAAPQAAAAGPGPQVAQAPAPMAEASTAPTDMPEAPLPTEMVPTEHLQSAPKPAAPMPVFQRRVVQHGVKRPIAPSRQAMADTQPSLPLDAREEAYEKPPLTLLTSADTVERHHLSDEALEENARMLENVLDDYGIKGEIVSVRPGPVVTMYELEPAPGLKASRVIGLADDIARSMSALSARVSTVPGRTVIGIELPNQNREKVVLREILSHRDFGDGSHKLPLALGKDIGGEPIIANLAKMPHLLIAGTTGSGKSVAINTMILSLLYKLTPDDCRLIMIDPKMLELSVYDGIPHLLSPVVTDPKKAVVALKWVVGEMEERYRKMSKMGVRNIDGYNGKVEDALSKGELFSRTVQTGFDDETGDPVFETEEFAPEKMPFIVVVVDEMADLMMVAGKEIEACIQRLAQMARASGIHLIMATQRPSVDVITGTIKANFPTRISFHVTSKVDSRTILGEMGAEQLLGMGDMLYMAGGAKITRVHGPFVSDEEVEEIVNHLKSFGPPDYAASVLDGPDDDRESDIDAVLGLGTGGNTTGEDALYDQAVAIVVKDRKCSTSYIQRKLGIGYNKAARLVEQMEEAGLVSGANHVGKREILVPEQE